MKKIIFAVEDQNKFSHFIRPYKHPNIALPENAGRVMFAPEYHAPLDKVYKDNGYQVVKKTVQQAYLECDSEPFVYMVNPQPNIFTLFKEHEQQIKDFFMSIDSIVIDAVNDGNCAFIIHNCKEQYVKDNQTEYNLVNFLQEIGFKNPKNIIVLENSPNAIFSDNFNFVQWNYGETAMRLTKFDITVNSKFKNSYKKFLCLNYVPRYHRQEFMYKMRDLNILDQFNASHNDPDLPLNYDVEDHNDMTNLKPSSGHIPMLIKDVNHWNTMPKKLSTDSLIFVVTDTPFQSDPLLFLTEKTFKPMLLKMPFIMLSNAGTLQYLKNIGYKTFDHVWDEQYDNILDQNIRMKEICNLILKLSKMDDNELKILIEKNFHIIEHNYNWLMSRRPEQAVFDAIDRSISRQ